MFSPTLILIARAIHIFSGVYWAGSIFVVAGTLLPAMRNPGAGPVLGPVMKSLGMRVGIAALLTILAGLYLMAALHPHDNSPSGIVLGVGAAAALLAFLVALAVSMPSGRKLAALLAAKDLGAEEKNRQMAVLQGRVVLAARAMAGLLGLTVLCMAAFRYAGLL